LAPKTRREKAARTMDHEIPDVSFIKGLQSHNVSYYRSTGFVIGPIFVPNTLALRVSLTRVTGDASCACRSHFDSYPSAPRPLVTMIPSPHLSHREARANAITHEPGPSRRSRLHSKRPPEFSKTLRSTEGPEKCEKVGVEFIFVRVAETVRGARVHLERCVLDESGRGVSRGADWHDLIVVPVDD